MFLEWFLSVLLLKINLIQESYYFFPTKKAKYWKIRISNKTIIGAELLIRQWNKLLLLFFHK